MSFFCFLLNSMLIYLKGALKGPKLHDSAMRCGILGGRTPG